MDDRPGLSPQPPSSTDGRTLSSLNPIARMAAFTSHASGETDGADRAQSAEAESAAPVAKAAPEPIEPPWPTAETPAAPVAAAPAAATPHRPTLGRLAPVEPSHLWPTETEFAAWLRDNPDGLGEALGMQLVNSTIPHAETPVVVAADASGAIVVIVAELGAASDEGFGRLVRNVTASSAAHGIWICAEPGEEYGASVSWLNRAVDARVSMVKVSAVTIGESAAAPMFEVMVRTPRASDEGVATAVPSAEPPTNTTRRVDDWLESVGARDPEPEADAS